ncbi:MAG TPA: hypothetical protein V6D19_19010 [Stenomitos sp.]
MSSSKILVRALLTGFALFNIASAPQAQAAPIIVIRGSHGAAAIVDSDRIPVAAQTLPSTPSQGFPQLAIRGSHGAAQIVSDSPKMDVNRMVSAVPDVVVRGPHGAAFVAP